MNELVLAMGIPSAVVGLAVWWLKRYIDARDKKAETREKTVENLMLLMMKEIRANNVLAEATAKAVQRIPDAHCNGDMTSALEMAAKIQKEERQFILDQGIKHVFGE